MAVINVEVSIYFLLTLMAVVTMIPMPVIGPTICGVLILMDYVIGKGAALKKVVLLGGAHHKVAYPLPPPVVVKVQLFFVGIFFCLESSDTEK